MKTIAYLLFWAGGIAASVNGIVICVIACLIAMSFLIIWRHRHKVKLYPTLF